MKIQNSTILSVTLLFFSYRMLSLFNKSAGKFESSRPLSLTQWAAVKIHNSRPSRAIRVPKTFL